MYSRPRPTTVPKRSTVSTTMDLLSLDSLFVAIGSVVGCFGVACLTDSCRIGGSGCLGGASNEAPCKIGALCAISFCADCEASPVRDMLVHVTTEVVFRSCNSSKPCG